MCSTAKPTMLDLIAAAEKKPEPLSTGTRGKGHNNEGAQPQISPVCVRSSAKDGNLSSYQTRLASYCAASVSWLLTAAADMHARAPAAHHRNRRWCQKLNEETRDGAVARARRALLMQLPLIDCDTGSTLMRPPPKQTRACCAMSPRACNHLKISEW
jgi:hypothetical protein